MTLLWLIVGLLIGLHAAHVRGFSPLFGAIVGVLLGPLALLMYAASGGNKCKYCLSAIPKGATVCAKCGRDQVDETPEGK